MQKEETSIEKCYSRKNYLLCLYKTKNLRTPVNNQTFLGLSSSIQDKRLSRLKKPTRRVGILIITIKIKPKSITSPITK